MVKTPDHKLPLIKTEMRIGFVLDEVGAHVDMEGGGEFGAAVLEKPAPKKMIFDQPFVVMLKRRDGDYPYFAMYVANTEWMFPPKANGKLAPLPFGYLP